MNNGRAWTHRRTWRSVYIRATSRLDSQSCYQLPPCDVVGTQIWISHLVINGKFLRRVDNRGNTATFGTKVTPSALSISLQCNTALCGVVRPMLTDSAAIAMALMCMSPATRISPDRRQGGRHAPRAFHRPGQRAPVETDASTLVLASIDLRPAADRQSRVRQTNGCSWCGLSDRRPATQHIGPVAQGIERRFPKPCVAGSNPAGATCVSDWAASPGHRAGSIRIRASRSHLTLMNRERRCGFESGFFVDPD
jgi:hypothetical protein